MATKLTYSGLLDEFSSAFHSVVHLFMEKLSHGQEVEEEALDEVILKYLFAGSEDCEEKCDRCFDFLWSISQSSRLKSVKLETAATLTLLFFGRNYTFEITDTRYQDACKRFVEIAKGLGDTPEAVLATAATLREFWKRLGVSINEEVLDLIDRLVNRVFTVSAATRFEEFSGDVARDLKSQLFT